MLSAHRTQSPAITTSPFVALHHSEAQYTYTGEEMADVTYLVRLWADFSIIQWKG